MASVEEIRAAIERANAEREAEKRRESERLRAAMGFLPETKPADEPPKAKPIARRLAHTMTTTITDENGNPRNLVYLGTFAAGTNSFDHSRRDHPAGRAKARP